MRERLSPSQVAILIARRDPAFAQLIDEIGPPPRRRASPLEQRYAALVHSICFQLLATRAAETIHARVVELYDGEVSAERTLKLGAGTLRGAGLSRAKALAIVELAERTSAGDVALARHGRMSDDAVIDDVTSVRGIGPWTAQMYLMFTLARADVWPSGDLGVRRGWSRVHGLDDLVSTSELHRVGEEFVGVRSALAWYCWRALE